MLETDDVDTQWRKMMRLLNVDVAHALSPQAKGKVERPYRWLQDRIVRTCVYTNGIFDEKLSTLEEVRSVLRDEVNRYNNHQVHSTTDEIPNIRFEKARTDGNPLFRPGQDLRQIHPAQALHLTPGCLLPARTDA